MARSHMYGLHTLNLKVRPKMYLLRVKVKEKGVKVSKKGVSKAGHVEKSYV